MTEEAIKQGDTVYLNSGGPAMTVVVIDGGGSVHCTWTSPHHPGMMRDAFPLACVTKKRPIAKG